ncbi:hypothetical protein DKX38_008821 [Salix brachista]|uniref:Wax synthase domain-containing protein n=1 Tax=Salix brachista TaxID=2182728 RepID=A0A5N5M936_9ROSI|nr:hypothetical protein DKX38_008821 [Salix brachista]
MVASISYPTVYNPIRSTSIRWISKKWELLPAVIGTFLASGLLHELIFYHIRSQKASVGGGSSTAFGGVCGGSSMPTVGRCKADVEARMEIISFINFVKGLNLATRKDLLTTS